MSRLSHTEREIAERIISGLSEALVTARTEARNAALEQAANAVEVQAAEAERFADICAQDGDGADDASRGAAVALRAAETAIRALIGTDLTTDRGEG